MAEKEIKAIVEEVTTKEVVNKNESLIERAFKQTIPVINIRMPEQDKSFKVIRHQGYEVDDKSKKPTVTFVSYKKELSIFLEHDEYIQFAHHSFVTNDQRLIDYLRNSPLYEKEIWEGEFPDYIKRKLEEERKYLTRDSEMFVGV